jgi:DNA repair photolyase
VFVRWENLTVEQDSRARLPGYSSPAVVRHFDAPEALDMRFYEVHAKSALNRVPERSVVPFRWTINPYRGCSHACVYCLSGDTEILLADGLTRPLADLEAGDEIYGTERRGSFRRLVRTEVLAQWTTVKAAFRIVLEDGTELVASGDHRFLTTRGWEFVIGTEQGAPRPHLTVGSDLVSAGALALPARAPAMFMAALSASPRADVNGRRTERDADAWEAGDRLFTPEAVLRVVAIEPLPRPRELVDITTGTGDFIANGVVSHNCFARPTHRYLDLDAGRDFEREIVVKVNAPEVLRRELARPSWHFEHVAMGTNTDPYQWVEGRYRLMRGIWEALRDARNPCSILTKSPLVLRDIDLLREIAEVTEVSASFSVPTLDEKPWRASEPHTPHPRARLEAVAELNRAGIPTGILIAPLMPGINDDPRQVAAIVEAARDAGASSIGGIALHMRGEVRDVFMSWLREARPELVARYERLYDGRAYAPKAERHRLARLVPRSEPPGDRGSPRLRAGADPHRAPPQPRRREPAQPTLF